MKHFLLLFTFAGLFALQLCAQDTTSMGTVYDSKGNEVYRKTLDEATLTTLTIPTQKLEIGLYFIKMDTPEHSRLLKFAVLR